MSDPIAASASLRRAVSKALSDVEPGELVLVGCSGGADSTALAVATLAVGSARTFRVGAVVVDHGLSPNSDQVAARVGARLDALGLQPVIVTRVEVVGRGGPEAAARAARYEALAGMAQREGARAVLLGHTLDDQAETVLLGLARGSGLRSIAGMTEKSGPGGLFRRPLLGIGRAVCLEACEGLEVWDDPHNHDDRYARVRVRRRLLPAFEAELGPGIAKALARTAELAAEAADVIDDWVDSIPPGPDLEVAELARLPAGVRTRLLHRAAIAAGVPAGSLTHEHVRSIDRFVTAWRGQGSVALPGGHSAFRAYGRLGFARATDAGLPAGEQWTPPT